MGKSFLFSCLAVFLLAACGKGNSADVNLSGRSCSGISFTAVSFGYADSSNGGQSYNINMQDLSMKYSDGKGTACTYTMTSQESQNLVSKLSGVSFCGPDGSSPVSVTVYGTDITQKFEMAQSSSDNVIIDGGFSQFQDDLAALKNNAASQGDCTDGALGTGLLNNL